MNDNTVSTKDKAKVLAIVRNLAGESGMTIDDIYKRIDGLEKNGYTPLVTPIATLLAALIGENRVRVISTPPLTPGGFHGRAYAAV